MTTTTKFSFGIRRIIRVSNTSPFHISCLLLARSDSSRDGLRLRVTRLGDDCHSVSCTLAWQETNLTQQLTRNLLHSNMLVSSAGGNLP